MPSDYNRVEQIYEDPRAGEQIRIREQKMPSRYFDDVYNRRPASAHPPYDYQVGRLRSHSKGRNLRDYNGYDSPRRSTREERSDDRRPRRSRRRSSSRSPDSSPRHRSRHDGRDRRDRRARSLSANGRDKERKSSDFFDRHFDKSLSGALAAAAGAGLGAIAARRFGDANPYRPDEDYTWKTIGGGAAGAALGNAAEKRYSQWKEDGKEEKRRKSGGYT